MGVALVRDGAAALYRLARRAGDGTGAALAALVLVDSTALRAEILRRSAIATAIPAHLVEPPIVGLLTGPVLDVRDYEVAEAIALAESPASRALRLEALAALYLVEHMGTGSQREKAVAALDRLAGDPDPLVAAAAKQLKRREFDKSELFLRASVLR